MKASRALGSALAAAVAVGSLSGTALAHAGSLRLASDPDVPLWLFLITGGGVVGITFLLASLMTDHDLIRSINRRGRSLDVESALGVAARVGRALGVVVLLAVVALGAIGPRDATTNFAMLVVWAGWWAGYTMTVYGVGNTWPALDPWRTLARVLPSLDRTYPDRLGAWPATVGLLGLVFVEVVTPIGDDPRLLSAAVAGYTVLTLAGAATYGAGPWFRFADPIARVFRVYGRMAPVQRTDSGISLRLPSAALIEAAAPDGLDEVGFVVALLWATTYDGLVSTPLWSGLIRGLVGVGAPPIAVYLLALVVGYGAFLGAYELAARKSRETANTYLAPSVIRERFVPSLLPIAAGYHLAHFLGYFIALAPALVAVATDPLSPPEAVVLVPPGWFGGLQLLFVLAGHVLAVWVAHAISFELFTGRLQPIRSQYPFIAVMITYTMISMWIVARPYTPPPYV